MIFSSKFCQFSFLCRWCQLWSDKNKQIWLQIKSVLTHNQIYQTNISKPQQQNLKRVIDCLDTFFKVSSKRFHFHSIWKFIPWTSLIDYYTNTYPKPMFHKVSYKLINIPTEGVKTSRKWKQDVKEMVREKCIWCSMYNLANEIHDSSW